MLLACILRICMPEREGEKLLLIETECGYREKKENTKRERNPVRGRERELFPLKGERKEGMKKEATK